MNDHDRRQTQRQREAQRRRLREQGIDDADSEATELVNTLPRGDHRVHHDTPADAAGEPQVPLSERVVTRGDLGDEPNDEPDQKEANQSAR